MNLLDIENALRLDLFDPTGPNQRWSNADLERAIDKAVIRYSQYYPNIGYCDMNTRPYQRTYPYPQPWNPVYPVWWIERIIYPLQAYGSYFQPPPGGMSASPGSSGGLSAGLYQYAVTFLSEGGETTPSPVISVSVTNNSSVSLSNIPLGPTQPTSASSAFHNVIGRNLYRTQAGGNTLLLLTTLAENSSTSYLDTTADSVLAGRPPAPTVNTSGVMLWPPLERDFAEYSNLFESSTALAAGGNLGPQGSAGSGQGQPASQTPSFTLKLSSSELPRDNTLVMRVFYATRHQLDSSGSTIPEMHRDLIVLGASLYAMEAYQVPTNDNFSFQDGELHDHLDDSAIPRAWQEAIAARRTQFEARLQEIRNQRDFASAARVQWGDIPARWARL
ncbi:MAG: hypothetical protein IRZ31_03270 [Thermogemmatispora sp.]|uniref:hypothetical protein n=1 Tax=Thermogemmatispora sp. TaxID=1968838 RepID=UPI00262C2DCF|nr:hypothetical protein [Thermogemmatispora sp.]MBX5455898.1 hypothetical protein [Thermogemmatispora sp.]